MEKGAKSCKSLETKVLNRNFELRLWIRKKFVIENFQIITVGKTKGWHIVIRFSFNDLLGPYSV